MTNSPKGSLNDAIEDEIKAEHIIWIFPLNYYFLLIRHNNYPSKQRQYLQASS